MKKLITAVVIAAAALIAVPTAANAAGYVPTGSVTVSNSVVAGGTTTVNIAAGAFVGNETVNITVTGAGAATIGALPTTTVRATKTASSNGSLAIAVTPPVGGSGTYSLTATGATSGNVATTALTVVPSAAGGAAASATNPGTGLAFTGSTVPALVGWAAGGAIALGVALMVVMGLVRRQRNAA
ncbi:hypothetical protein [Curtobacterium sp. Leaf261]|uniref:hypothetical protein n=1 Tax=Curtobacterium sp. Leaf261 TaxID=1736311 RepID=UPI0006F80041|nr:hypothetical protein [Curtobacterium sp. Leaf261]KQO62320.1 hypothetical protein ASF23_11015 [Curtobacterium sp. Leaf261]